MPPKRTVSKNSSRKPTAAARPKKRKAASEPDDATDVKQPAKASKRAKQVDGSKNGKTSKQTKLPKDESPEEEGVKISINRAPVLELWGACVAHFLHPDFSWTLCLSIGSSIATITAISKGRSIGTIAQSDPEKQKKSRAEDGGDEELPTAKVMGFPMRLKGDAVIVKGKPKQARDVNLKRKFGEENLELVKSAMLKSLRSWAGHEEDLDSEAFHMYEQFRPSVAAGQQGWGRKGELRLSQIEEVVQRQDPD